MSVAAEAAHQSQTLIRFSTGAIQTLPAVTADFNLTPGAPTASIVKNAGFLYEKGSSAATILSMGANYALNADGSILTVSENGFLFNNKTTYSASAIGGNYFVNKGTNEVIVVDSSGCFSPSMTIANNVRLLGGNFFIDQAGLLTTIKHMGVGVNGLAAPCSVVGMVIPKMGLGDFSSAIKAGGNYFLNVDGTIVGINSENGFFTSPQKVDSTPKQIGGNYFVGEDKVLYTVSDQGFVMKKSPVLGKILVYGYSYLLADDGYFIFVDGKGIAHTELVQVSGTGSGKVVSQIQGSFSLPTSFIPAQQ